MARQEEIVFEILFEGGRIRIVRLRTKSGEKFVYHHNEFDPTDEGLDHSKKGEYKNFEQPFQLINNKYPWYMLSLETVHEDFRDYILSELIKKLHKHGVSPDEIRYTQHSLEETLNIKLEFGSPPLKSSLQNIKVVNLMKLTEYDYQEYTEESGKQLRIKGKCEILTDEQQYNSYYNEIIKEKYDFETVGKLEVSGNTILIKNEFNQIEYVFSSQKFFVSTTPILSKSKGWYYKTK